MTSDLYNLLKNDSTEFTPRNDFLKCILENIRLEQNKVIRRQKIIWRSVFFVFLMVTVATGWHAFSSLSSSDFGNYFSLIFSDTNTALAVWKELSISILETLPIFGIGLFLASIYLLFWSARKYAIRSHTLAY